MTQSPDSFGGGGGDSFGLAGTLTGRVSAAGAAINGTGFASSRSGVGVYHVAFDAAYPEEPDVQLTLVSSDNYLISLANLATASFDVIIRDALGNLRDIAFTFLVVPTR